MLNYNEMSKEMLIAHIQTMDMQLNSYAKASSEKEYRIAELERQLQDHSAQAFSIGETYANALSRIAELEAQIAALGTEPEWIDGRNDDPAEAAFWRFDARKKGYSRWKGVPQSERDAFKAEYRAASTALQAPVREVPGYKLVPLEVTDAMLEAWKHELCIPVGSSPEATKPAQDESDEDTWRRLALQFDGHRMMALSHLRAMLQDAQKHTPLVEAFLKAPPMDGETVLAQRIAALASPAQALSAVDSETVKDAAEKIKEILYGLQRYENDCGDMMEHKTGDWVRYWDIHPIIFAPEGEAVAAILQSQGAKNG